MLGPEPRAAKAHDRAPAADMVDRHERFRREPGVAERVGADEQAEPDALGRLGPGRQGGVALEDRLERVTEDRVEVVPRPDVVEAQPLGALRGPEERRPVAGLAPERDSHATTVASLLLCSAGDRIA